MAGTGQSHLRRDSDVLLQVKDLTVEFPAGAGNVVHAVSGISFDVAKGETLGLVGESGCGKSTTGRAVLQLPTPTSGSVRLNGEDLTELDRTAMRAHRTDVQMIFQDPISSLNPRRTIGEVVAEPLHVWGPHDKDEQWKIVSDMLDHVGIDPDVARYKRPHEFSGGQCQRISIARALVMEPELIICDEPVSALDVSVQAQILNLLEDLKAEYGLTLVFIAHDLAVVKNISDRVAVMYLGKMCELSESDELYAHPAHPYTRLLMESHPEPDPLAPIDETISAEGELPSPIAPPSGCRFRTRCPLADERCAREEPQMRRVNDDHFVACHHPLVEVKEVAIG
ncbi:MAG: ATP-binding cassette domain-containing protein [Ilumatobacter sp.]|uniref:ABC transporter ATP-binding protein n=1 Tax=Ilumatobacter sp. TaxID=1967498 RepID=UPI00261CA1DE|nr:oligopeptide/dipeptide ABC transporter ATP-binding protein [Ilumatobacter sp.]MDJ0769574.1 ATP-binding cassette domain-containing protein [Ilumatobacter sp.]